MATRKLSQFPWLEASLVSFNGSGYADRKNAETYLESYLAYQTMKQRAYGMEMVTFYWRAALTVAEYIVREARPAGRYPSSVSLRRFGHYYPPARR